MTMTEEEYISADNECISMVEANRTISSNGEPLILMSKKQATDLLRKASQNTAKAAELQEVTKDQRMLRAALSVVPICIGAACILGAFEGRADPAFTVVISSVCIMWSCVEWQMGKRNGQD